MTKTPTPAARRLLPAAALALLAAGALTSCGSDDDASDDDDGAVATEGDSTPADGGEAGIDIVSVPDGFGPATLTVAVGTEVVWTNIDASTHTSTAEGGAWDSGSLDQDGSFSFTATESGTFAYFCAIHPSMVGELIVE